MAHRDDIEGHDTESVKAYVPDFWVWLLNVGNLFARLPKKPDAEQDTNTANRNYNSL